MTAIRPPAVAGMFYPGSAVELSAVVRDFMDHVPESDAPVPKAIIVPHAGYRYSGAIAAAAYARLKPAHDVITRVILLGPCHRVAVNGLAAPSVDAFATPLGNIPLDRDAIAAISVMPQVSEFDATHADEHSLEVHLPFLQEVLDDFILVPLVVGSATNSEVAQVLDALWGGTETVIVISSDLSHYLDYDAAREIDQRTCDAIEHLDPDAIGSDQACGRIPVKGLLSLAAKRHMRVETVGLKNSGDTAGSKDKVVGYGAWVFEEPDADATDAVAGDHEVGTDFEAATTALLKRHGALLLKLAGASIEHGLAQNNPVDVDVRSFPDDLQQNGACFVTLYKKDRLRGCIGSPEAHRPLITDVVQNAYRAAFHDPRFPNLTADEIPDLHLSISVLSPASPMTIESEAHLLAQLRPGVDGLIIMDGGQRALFLPSVWEQLPEPENFLRRLKLKAGMAADYWSDGFQAQRFITGEVKQSELPEPESIWNQASG
ncbi:MAG: AmmeMemoRadiSam system protein B [Alphaproteobacteria bacterium]|nr:AmmeMemoRadiSam system protein B [Alphaproteobacteria bacterium]